MDWYDNVESLRDGERSHLSIHANYINKCCENLTTKMEEKVKLKKFGELAGLQTQTAKEKTRVIFEFLLSKTKQMPLVLKLHQNNAIKIV